MLFGAFGWSLVYVDVPLYGWNNWHFPATIGGLFGTIGTLKYSVQDVAGEVCMSDNRMASSECSKVGSQFNTLPAPSVSCVDVLANRVLGVENTKGARFGRVSHEL